MKSSDLQDPEVVRALDNLATNPYFRVVLRLLEKSSADADTRAINEDTNSDIYRGRARAFREIVAMLRR